jgi:hypothetical protein
MKKWKKIIIKPHSSGDWDFSSTDWELDAVRFHSAPTSWRAVNGQPNSTRALVKTPTAPIAYFKQGRMTNWIYMRQVFSAGVYERLRFYFRWQDANNFYCVEILWTGSNWTWSVIRSLASIETTLRSSTLASYPPASTWWTFRITWWVSEVKGLVVRVERYTGSEWVTLFGDAYDSNDYWKDTGGRIGHEGYIIGAAPNGESGNVDDQTFIGDQC